MTVMDLYLTTNFQTHVYIYNTKGENIYVGLLDKVSQEQLDLVIKNVEAIGVNELILTVN